MSLRTRFRRAFTVLSILLVAFTSILSDYAGRALADEAPTALVLSVEARQLGSSEVVLILRGRNLPRPLLLRNEGSEMEFLLAETLPSSEEWNRDYGLPLLQAARLAASEEGLRLQLTLSYPLDVAAIKGDEGSGTMEFRLRTRSAEAAAEALSVPAPSTAGDPMTKTTPVNLELRGSDLHDVFRLLGGMVGKNIIVDPSVPPETVTMSLKGVPLNQAFGYLMRMYGISYVLMGNTIVVGTPASLGQTMGMEVTKGFRVAYADPAKVPAMLQGLAGVERVVVDERLRTVYVTGRPEQLRDVEAALRKIDHPGRQIMLQARILEIKDEGKKELEALIEGVYKHWWFNYGSQGGAIGYVYNNKPGQEIYDPVTGDSRPIGPNNFGLEDIAGGTFRMLDAGLRALVTENKGKVLASPSVITMDGEKAIIKLVEKYKFISERDEAGNPTYDEEEVGPHLEFTPVMGRGGVITVDLKVATGSVIGTYRGGQGEEFPQTSSREVTTKVRVSDGEPFVVGGLFSEENRTVVTKIPILGDIPLLGEIFRSSSKQQSNSEVVMVVVPYILDVDETVLESIDL